MKIAINTCYGGFGLSQKALKRLIELGVPLAVDEEEIYGVHITEFTNSETLALLGPLHLVRDFEAEYRTHPLVIQVIEELEEKAYGDHAELKIVDIPDNVKWSIQEYDGVEWIAEDHRTWR